LFRDREKSFTSGSRRDFLLPGKTPFFSLQGSSLLFSFFCFGKKPRASFLPRGPFPSPQRTLRRRSPFLLFLRAFREALSPDHAGLVVFPPFFDGDTFLPLPRLLPFFPLSSQFSSPFSRRDFPPHFFSFPEGIPSPWNLLLSLTVPWTLFFPSYPPSSLFPV